MTFVCELDRVHLTELFSEGSLIDDLKALGAHVLLMLSDFSPERTDVVKGLNVASVGSMKLTRFAAKQSHRFCVSDGKVTEYWPVRNELAMVRQLGVMPQRIWRKGLEDRPHSAWQPGGR